MRVADSEIIEVDFIEADIIEVDKSLRCKSCNQIVRKFLFPDGAEAINSETPEDFPKICECRTGTFSVTSVKWEDSPCH